MTNKKKRLWDQMEGESNNAYLAFKEYLDLEPPRSLKKLSDTKKDYVYGTIRNYAHWHKWTIRESAFMAYQDQQSEKELLKRKKKVHFRNLEIVEHVGKVLLKKFRKVTDGEEDISMIAATKLFGHYMKASLLAVGEPTEIIEERKGAQGFGNLTDEQIETLMELIDQMENKDE